jgi:MSHA pilin protein MshD
VASSPSSEAHLRVGGYDPRAHFQRGFTLIEVIVSIVVLAIAIVGVVAGLSAVAVRSATAMVNEQAVAIASSYLNEVLQKPFGVADGKIVRSQLDVVDDYAGLTNVGVQDQTGTAVAGLGGYTVAVTVLGVPGGPPAAPLGGVLPAQLREVDVTVSNSSGVLVVLSGYRTKY